MAIQLSGESHHLHKPKSQCKHEGKKTFKSIRNFRAGTIEHELKQEQKQQKSIAEKCVRAHNILRSAKC